jgi:NAD(P)-dependent dehydrogenase (short-subunit alcohol dehydrogenase family)
MSRYVAVVGATGSIGFAFVQALRNQGATVFELSRSGAGHIHVDLLQETSITQAASELKARLGEVRLDMLIDATGALTIDGRPPEKSLSAISSESLTAAFQVNAIGAALLLKHMCPLLVSGRCVYAKLSARVGSIGDNRKGGWYGYRASKAALNMLLHTAALELQRKNKDCIVAALQPGTVASNLSAAFVKAQDALTPEESAVALLRVLVELTPISGAHFVDYQGQRIEW